MTSDLANYQEPAVVCDTCLRRDERTDERELARCGNCLATVPEPWSGGGHGPHQAEGFACRLTRAGAAMMSAYRRSLVRMIKDGCRLAIDETLLDAQIGPGYADRMEPFDALELGAAPGDPVVLLAYFLGRATARTPSALSG